MAKIRISSTKQRKRVVPKKQRIVVSIPEKPSKICTDFRRYSVMLHGEKKIGKTTLFAQEEGAFFLEFDPLQSSLAIRQRHVPSWPHFVAYLDLLEKDPGTTKTVIVDGTDIAYQTCFNWCCQKMAIGHPHDENDYGKSWNFIRAEFERAMLRILSLEGIAPRFVSHSKWAEIKTRSGGKVDKLIPFMTSQAEEVLNGRIDIWAAYTYVGRKRVLVLEGSEEIGAGHRCDGRFQTPEGEAIQEIDMGKSAKESYQNLLTAFNNQQTYVNLEERMPKKSKKSKKTKKKKMKVRIRK